MRIRPNTTIGGALRMDDLFRDGYSAVFIGTGVWRPNSLGIKGESLGNVHFAIDYLCNPAVYNLGETVSVIGAGNAAIDAARTILRHGARKVTITPANPCWPPARARWSTPGWTAWTFTIACGPWKSTRKERCSAAGLRCGRPCRRSGRRGFSGASDSVVIAIGQGPKDKIVSTSRGIEINERGLVKTDAQGATTHPASSPRATWCGRQTVVEAVHCSKTVADAWTGICGVCRVPRADYL